MAQFDYSHPQFGLASVAAQARLPSIQGARRVWFAGAWCGYGFHEDGLNAGIAVAAGLGVGVPWAPVAASPAVPDSAPLAAAA